jgi:thymidine kinase
MLAEKSTGYLELIIGPMFSGKTSKLLEIYKQCLFCDISVAVINHSIDNRYDDEMLSTHDKRMIPCTQTRDLRDIWNNSALEHHLKKLRGADVILINEGQFFDDLYEVVSDMLDNNKIIYVAGLDGDFERKKFGQILDLVPLSDKVTKLTSLCSQCKNGTNAIFSARLSTEKQQTLVGSSNYLPVCRKCYNIFIKTI